jgi:hypothetical protein
MISHGLEKEQWVTIFSNLPRGFILAPLSPWQSPLWASLCCMVSYSVLALAAPKSRVIGHAIGIGTLRASSSDARSSFELI